MAKALGILRVAPGTGITPECDDCHSDGWYYGESGHRIARETYERWRKQYAGWTVALISVEKIDFGLDEQT